MTDVPGDCISEVTSSAYLAPTQYEGPYRLTGRSHSDVQVVASDMGADDLHAGPHGGRTDFTGLSQVRLTRSPGTRGNVVVVALPGGADKAEATAAATYRKG